MSVGNILSSGTVGSYNPKFTSSSSKQPNEPLASLPIIYLDDPPQKSSVWKNALFTLGTILTGAGIVYLTKSKALESIAMDGVVYSRGMEFKEARGIMQKAKMAHIKLAEGIEFIATKFYNLFSTSNTKPNV